MSASIEYAGTRLVAPRLMVMANFRCFYSSPSIARRVTEVAISGYCN